MYLNTYGGYRGWLCEGGGCQKLPKSSIYNLWMSSNMMLDWLRLWFWQAVLGAKTEELPKFRLFCWELNFSTSFKKCWQWQISTKFHVSFQLTIEFSFDFQHIKIFSKLCKFVISFTSFFWSNFSILPFLYNTNRGK